MDRIFKREGFAEWTIVVKDRMEDELHEEEFAETGIFGACLDFEEFSGSFRTTMSNGKQCELFTLFNKNISHTFLWVELFKNGEVQYVSHIPSLIKINRRKKIIEILPLVYCKYDNAKRTIRFTYIGDLESNYTLAYK